MADKTSDAIKLNLRLPKPLHRRLKQQAKRNNVSLNTEIVNQLEAAEVATAKRMAEAMKPLLEEAIETAVANVTRRVPSEDEIMLAILLRGPEIGLPVAPKNEFELEERLRQMGAPSDRAAALLQIFREIQTGIRVQSTDFPWAWLKP
jgi:hypothetical protein